MSAESGIPTYRSGEDALWARADFERYANPRGYREHASDAWRWYAQRAQIARDAQPNAAHYAIREIERRSAVILGSEATRGAVILGSEATRGSTFLLATQNIDGLHHRAGSEKVLELHGTLRRARCFDCGEFFEWPDPLGEPVCPRCGGLLRPDVVMFEEMLPDGAMEQALDAARECDVLLSVGTSNLVYPAAEIPRVAMRAGATVVVVNPEMDGQPWGRTMLRIPATAATALPRIVELAWP